MEGAPGLLVGQPLPRREDPRLLQGQGRYTDDLNLPGQAHAVFVRSPYAHGIIRAIDLEAARATPGVIAIFTGQDLEAGGFGHVRGSPQMTSRDGSPVRVPPRPALTVDKVRYVGDAFALVVAETAFQAKDAAELVGLEVDPLPVVLRLREAASPTAARLHESVPNNTVVDYHWGETEKVAEAFSRAPHVTRLSLICSRVVVCPMEPRGAIAAYDAAEDRWTLHTATQGVFGFRNVLAERVLKTAPEKLHVLTGNVGGSFGMRNNPYVEHAALLFAARALSRPVKWMDERSGSFISDSHSRDHEYDAELALDAQGNFLAVRVQAFGNIGAYTAGGGPMASTTNLSRNLIGVYKTPLMEMNTLGVLTNTVPFAAYRGNGRPEANYIMERLVDAAAHELGIDPAELRRRNHIRPDQMPYAAPSGAVYDSGQFSSLLDKALKQADWVGFAARKKDSAARGKLRGIGLSDYLEATGPAIPEMGGLRFDEDGGVTIITGTLDYGQGHAVTFGQVLADRLGIPLERVRLLQGDSDELIAGGGTGGSRSMVASGAAIIEASDLVIEKAKPLAATELEAAEADIEFSRGRFTIVGTDRSIGLLELAAKWPRALDVRHKSEGKPAAYPNGCHVAEVEIDPETGVVEVVAYHAVCDFGVQINPLVVEGQVHGGVVQGIGQTVMERVVYDEDGQLLSGTFMDYALPRASDVPFFDCASHPVPATTNALGAKGCGEAGCAGSMASMMNAIADALRAVGVTHVDMPATPLRVWQMIQAAKG